MKKKIQLKNIAVQSFVTQLPENQKHSVKGGAAPSKETCGSCMAFISCYITDCIDDPIA